MGSGVECTSHVPHICFQWLWPCVLYIIHHHAPDGAWKLSDLSHSTRFCNIRYSRFYKWNKLITMVGFNLSIIFIFRSKLFLDVAVPFLLLMIYSILLVKIGPFNHHCTCRKYDCMSSHIFNTLAYHYIWTGALLRWSQWLYLTPTNINLDIFLQNKKIPFH